MVKAKEATPEEVMDAMDPADNANAVATTGGRENLPSMSVGEVAGEFQPDEIKLPTINIVQKSGELADTFDFGDILLSKEYVLSSLPSKTDDRTNPPVELTVAAVRKMFQENLPYGSGVIPRRFGSLEEVRAEGLTLQWGLDDTPPSAIPVAELLVVVKKPENLTADAFPWEYEGEHYSPAKWFVAKSAYKNVMENAILRRSMIVLKLTGLMSGNWHLTAMKKTSNGNTWCVPVLSLLPERHSKEFIDWATEKVSQ